MARDPSRVASKCYYAQFNKVSSNLSNILFSIYYNRLAAMAIWMDDDRYVSGQQSATSAAVTTRTPSIQKSVCGVPCPLELPS